MAEKTHEQLLSGAAEVFANHKGQQKVWATSDGNYWLESFKSLADDHARRNGGMQVIGISREEVGEAPKTVKLAAAPKKDSAPKKDKTPAGDKPKKDKAPKELKAPAAGAEGQPGAGADGEPGTGNEGTGNTGTNDDKE
jgi:hypothetical protein